MTLKHENTALKSTIIPSIRDFSLFDSMHSGANEVLLPITNPAST